MRRYECEECGAAEPHSAFLIEETGDGLLEITCLTCGHVEDATELDDSDPDDRPDWGYDGLPLEGPDFWTIIPTDSSYSKKAPPTSCLGCNELCFSTCPRHDEAAF